jgi:hypothetical protein
MALAAAVWRTVTLRLRSAADAVYASPDNGSARRRAVELADHRFVEKPIRTGPANPRMAYALGGVLALIAAGGGAAYATDGFVYRFPPQLVAILKWKYDYVKEYRMGTCLLDTGQDESRFKDCTSRTGDNSTESILLWGDSHAAHLYPSFLRTLDARTKLTELTASFCPPIIGYVDIAHPQCAGINRYVMDWIEKQRPSRVILAAIWRRYDWFQLDGTIRELERLRIPQIDVVGPVPIRHGTLEGPTVQLLQGVQAEGNSSLGTGKDDSGIGRGCLGARRGNGEICGRGGRTVLIAVSDFM